MIYYLMYQVIFVLLHIMGMLIMFNSDYEELRRRFKQYRINASITQKDLADRSGVSARSISRFENGEDIGLGNFIRLLDELELSKNLDMLIPDLSRRPSYYLEGEKQRMRASTRKTKINTNFKWGDEK